MDPSCLVSTVQAGGGGGVMGVGIFSWHTLGPLVQIEHCLCTTAYLSIVADHVQIKSNQITFIVTSPQHKCLGEWNSYERAPDSAEKQQTIYIWTDSAKKQQTIYLWTDSAKKQQTIYLWTDSAKKQQTIYIWTDSAKKKQQQFTYGQTVQKNNNSNLHMDRQCKKQQQFTYGQYIFTDCTEDNVQNTHTLHVYPFMTTVYPSFDGYFQQDNAPCHKAQIISDWFHEHDNEFTLLKWPPQSPDLNPIEHLWDVVEWEIHIMGVQPTNLQQLRDAIMSILTKISEECFNTLLNLCHKELENNIKDFYMTFANMIQKNKQCTNNH